MRVKLLEEMATKIVGDGKAPNLYFVSRRGNITAVFVDGERAFEFAKDGGGDLVEDRVHGTVAEKGADW